jgi:hypothetical protein
MAGLGGMPSAILVALKHRGFSEIAARYNVAKI